MIALTKEAAAAIQQLVAEHPGAGLRILSRPAGGEDVALHLEMKSAPASTDEVVEDRGSRVFIDKKIVPLLVGKTLDAEATGDTGLRFRLVS